jgi:hypothetical protein
MGVETPIPPIVMNAAAPGGVPPRRIKKVSEYFFTITIKLPCRTEALRRVTIATMRIYLPIFMVWV